MTERTHCIYCNKEITTRSKEHVIQNALGGLLESTDICCADCNNFISKYIDAPFTKTFNPIISQIQNFSKTNNTKSLQPCTGKVLYNGELYDANIKAGKVVSCPELSRKLRCDISKLPLEIINYNFDLQNCAFETGLAKIAFNYAISQNVDLKYLEHGLKVEKSGNTVQQINYNYKIIPFCPINPVDKLVELNGNYTNLFHNMILFSQYNELWCYIDLFNTFQYYVLLSDNLPKDKQIYSNYIQTLQKQDHSVPDLGDLRKPKDIMIIAQQYGVEPCMDKEEFTKRVRNAIERKSQKTTMAKIYAPRIMCAIDEIFFNSAFRTPDNLFLFNSALCLYYDDDVFHTKNFRTLTPAPDGSGVISYPHANKMQPVEEIRKYTLLKFDKLNRHLCQQTH